MKSFRRWSRYLLLAAGVTSFSAAAAWADPDAVINPQGATMNENTSVVFDGSASTPGDPNQGEFNIIAYQWFVDSLQNFVGSGPQFTYTAPNLPGPDNVEHTIILRVYNNNIVFNDESVVVTVVDVNENPTPNAGADKTINEGQSVTFSDAAYTDPNNDPMASVTWSPATGLNDPNILRPTYTAPSVTANTFVDFTVTVTDARGLQGTDVVRVNIININQPPTANAGDDKSVIEGGAVLLSGSGSDPDGDTVTFAWTQIAGPTNPLLNPTSPTPTFQAPANVNTETLYTYRLVVRDQPGNLTATDDVSVTVTNGLPPVANAGSNDFATERTTVTLLGSATDADNQVPLTFSWAKIAGPNVILLNPNTAQPTFLAPEVDNDTFITFRLTVTDQGGNSDTADVTWVIRDVSQALPQNPLLTNLAIYPSPFTASDGATVRYDLRVPADVNILIVDVFGRVVRELTVSNGGAGGASGTNTVKWDGKNGAGDFVGNGAYIVQVRASDGSGAKGKMTERVGVRN